MRFWINPFVESAPTSQKYREFVRKIVQYAADINKAERLRAEAEARDWARLMQPAKEDDPLYQGWGRP